MANLIWWIEYSNRRQAHYGQTQHYPKAATAKSIRRCIGKSTDHGVGHDIGNPREQNNDTDSSQAYAQFTGIVRHQVNRQRQPTHRKGNADEGKGN